MNEVEALTGRAAQNALRDVTARYRAFDFFTPAKSNITRDIDLELRAAFEDVRATVDGFNLIDVDVATARFDQSRARLVSAQADRGRAQEELALTAINVQARVARAQIEAFGVTLSAQSDAERTRTQTLSTIIATEARLRAEAEAYAALKENMGFTTEQLLAYAWLETVREAQAAGTLKPILADSHSPANVIANGL
jgi:regulator of protease activity HflC (stomatin/prohibitin superfamily)